MRLIKLCVFLGHLAALESGRCKSSFLILVFYIEYKLNFVCVMFLR